MIPAPTFSPPGGTYAVPQSVKISCIGANDIYYTTDGSAPTTASAKYSSPIVLGKSATINAIGVLWPPNAPAGFQL